jgi:hypothetical protein
MNANEPKIISKGKALPEGEMLSNQPQDRHVIAIYNPYLRSLLVHFLDYDHTVTYDFESECEWVYISHPAISDQYLAIQLDYDEFAQLIIYYEEGEEADYVDSDSWNADGRHRDSNIFIVHSDMEWQLKIDLLDKIEFYPSVHEIKFKDTTF